MAATIAFTATGLPDGSERFELHQQNDGGLLRKAKSDALILSKWIRSAPTTGMAALSRLRSLPGGELISEDDTGVMVPAGRVSQLTELEAISLGLPPATNLTLQLRSTGSLHKGTISIERNWIRRGGIPVRARIEGARIRETSGVARLPEPLYSTYSSLLHLEQTDQGDERRAAFAELREKLGEISDASIDVDGFISQVRIAYASHFSLDLRTHGGLFDFDPVLFSRSVGENEDGDLIDATAASLLTEHEQQKFRARFRSQNGGRRSYLLADGTILYLDPNLGRALDIVRQKQSAPEDERRRFARSPQTFIREGLDLDDAGDDEAADHLFIETQQFSDRIAGIEVWQKPVLPWIKPASNSWLPESFGIRIGEGSEACHVVLEPGDAKVLETAISEAIDQGRESTNFKNEAIPATPAAQSAARAIVELEDEIARAQDEASADCEPKLELPTYFLSVGENFQQLDYARLVDRSSSKDFDSPAIPSDVRSSPKPHQLEGFAWLSEAWSRQMPGLLLADDMGLGKTFQALTFLLWLRGEKSSDRPVLIVAPTGLLRNWRAEIDLHLRPGALGPVVEAFGANLKHLREGAGNDIRGGTSKLNVSRWQEAGVILTTFETMRDYHMSFARVPFSAIVFDEIQKLKNPASQMTRAAKTLNAKIQVGMTGTPVENRLQDLWTISDVVYPGFLGTSREFETAYPPDNPDAMQSLQSQLIDRDGNLPPFMLRRMKEGLLAGLPKKRVVTYAVTMPVAQATAYDQVLARARALRQSGSKGAMLKILHMLRGTSLHHLPPLGLTDFSEYIAASARLAKTFELLDDIKAAGEKVLIFCEDLNMQSFLAIATQERFALPRPIPIINGSIPGTKRQDIVTDFQSRSSGFDAMILSPKAGGVGLTITAANHVIHLSRWWNPAVEDQATDRVYRIGQDKPVTVHIPLAVHPDEVIGPSSFDVRLNDLMERKRALSRGLLVPPESDADVNDMLAGVLDGEETAKVADEPALDENRTDPGDGLASESSIDSTKNVKTDSDKDNGALRSPDEAVTPTERPVGATDVNPPSPARLSVRLTPSLRRTPVDVAQARSPEIHRVVYEVGGLREWTIFTQHIEKAAIKELDIVDPYCCADESSRRRLVDFVARFAGTADKIAEVSVTCFDAASLQKSWESNEDQLRDFEQRLTRKLPGLKIQLRQKSRRAVGDLHDRSVTAVLADGDRVIWDLGRGIDGVMTARFSCVVNVFREKAAAVALH